MTTNQNRVQAGVPTGGQFAAGSKSESGETLTISAAAASTELQEGAVRAREFHAEAAELMRELADAPPGGTVARLDEQVNDYALDSFHHLRTVVARAGELADARPGLAGKDLVDLVRLRARSAEVDEGIEENARRYEDGEVDEFDYDDYAITEGRGVLAADLPQALDLVDRLENGRPAAETDAAWAVADRIPAVASSAANPSNSEPALPPLSEEQIEEIAEKVEDIDDALSDFEKVQSHPNHEDVLELGDRMKTMCRDLDTPGYKELAKQWDRAEYRFDPDMAHDMLGDFADELDEHRATLAKRIEGGAS